MEKCKRISLKVLCIMLLMIVAICFSACAEIRAMIITNEDGTIDELVYITLDKEKVENAGADYKQVQDTIKNDCLYVASKLSKDFDIKAMSTPKSYVYLQSVKPISSEWSNDTFVIGLRFENINVYNFYYNITEDVDIKADVEEHFLYDKITYKGVSTFAVENSLYGHLYKHFDKNYSNLVDFSNTQLLYTIVTESRREHSDANYVNKVDGKYYHTWELKTDETSKQIEIYYNLANRGNCILACVLSGLVVCGILLSIGFVVTKIKSKKLKNKQETRNISN